MSVSLFNQVIDTPKEVATCAYIRNIGNKVVELNSITHHCTIALSLNDYEAKIDETIKKLVNIIISYIEDDYPIKTEAGSYMKDMLISALNHGHGNLIAVTDNIEQLKAEKHLHGGIYLQEEIDLAKLLIDNNQEKTDRTATTLNAFTQLVISMLNFDGITLFSTTGTILGYHFIVDNKIDGGNQIVGGSRSRAFEALTHINGISASDKNAIVTIGIKPSRPETGYGYIAAVEPTSVDEIYKVEAFKEKPNLKTAEQYLAAGNYYWNTGIFVWNIDTISKAIRTFQPQLASIMDEMAPSFYTEQEKEVVGKLFPTCEKISIDYAVMEKSKEIYTLPAEFGWSDLGSWGSLRTLLPQDEAGNAKVGKDIRLYECKNCVVHAADESKVVVQGLNGYIVAEKNGQLLVCSLKEEQRIKEFGK